MWQSWRVWTGKRTAYGNSPQNLGQTRDGAGGEKNLHKIQSRDRTVPQMLLCGMEARMVLTAYMAMMCVLLVVS